MKASKQETQEQNYIYVVPAKVGEKFLLFELEVTNR